MLHPHKKKKKNWLRSILFFAILFGGIFICVRFRAQIMRYSETAWLIIKKPDIASILHAVRREDFGMLCITHETGADDCYVFDNEGVVFDSARMVVGDVIARVDDASQFKPVLGAMFTDADTWRHMAEIIAYVKDELSIHRMVFARAERELTVILTDSETRLYFALDMDPAEHIRALRELAKTTPLTTLEYADLRIKGRMFYK